MARHTSPSDRLAMLAAHLSAHGYETEPAADGLVVRGPTARGCCGIHPAMVVLCEPRADDGGRLWFITSWRQPLAEHDQITQAVTAIKGLLSRSKAATEQ